MGRESLISSSDTDTTNLDFTTELRASRRTAAPRRRQTNGRARKGEGLAFSIHEDEEVKSFPSRAIPKGSPIQIRHISSIMAHPPQRFHTGATATTDAAKTGPKIRNAEQTDNSNRAVLVENAPVESRMKKPARRGTIYVPNEDTTMPTVFMGIFSPIKDLAAGQQDGRECPTDEITGIAAQMAQKKPSRRSLAAAPAKRAPLHKPRRILQETIDIRDRPGQSTGKENVPPGHDGDALTKRKGGHGVPGIGHSRAANKAGHALKAPLLARRASILPAFQNTQAAKRTVRAPPRKSILQRSDEVDTRPGPTTVKADTSKAVSPLLTRLQVPNDYPRIFDVPQVSPSKGIKSVPIKLSVPFSRTASICQQFPLLTEDIINPSMYEDHWLGHQEIAITQLVNNIFSSSSSSEARSVRLLRLDLLEIYLSESFSLLYKRLQASLLYGALSVPKDLLARGSRLNDDLGIRRRFLDLWIKTYHPRYLRAAAEVVIGRQCPVSPRGSSTASSPTIAQSPKYTRKSIESFLEIFLMRNEDHPAQPKTSALAHTANSYRRTLHRSLLLIQLLDRARTANPPLLPGAIFLTASPYKSSASVLQALGSLLLPSHGDLSRPLTHLEYLLFHVQYPLEEYKYTVENLAIDLRDGVRLTRLVEMLLYPPASHQGSCEDTTTTIVMSTGKVLDLREGPNDWPLSQHLKFPCLGRATKIFNVQIALSALQGIQAMEKLVEGVTAEDIVDGYREKTVGILWGLVGRWGVGGLIDFNDVQVQTRKVRCRLDSPNNTEAEDYSLLQDEKDDPEAHIHHLRAWAEAIAQSRGIPLLNLTTSFSDGRIFSAIVDEYERYLPPMKVLDLAYAPLNARLQALGCSTQFSQLFTGTDKVFDRDTTVAALAFLASRVLGASKRTRAALTIQRAWRASLAVKDTRRKVIKRRLARQCAVVVGVRERVGLAKATILKAWRIYRDRKARRQEATENVGWTRFAETSDIWLDIR